MTTAITVYDRVHDPHAFIRELGAAIAKSGMFNCSSMDQGLVLATECATQRCTPLTLARRFDIIQNKLSMKSAAMIGAFRRAGGKHKRIKRTPDKAEVELTFDGETCRFSFTWEEAQQERYIYGKDGKTLKDNWATPRGRMHMLWWRVVSEGVDVMAPEISSGYATDDEPEGPIVSDGELIDADFESLPNEDVVVQVISKPGQPVTTNTEPAAVSAAESPPSAAPQSVPFDPYDQHTLERLGSTGIDMLKSQATEAGLSMPQAKSALTYFCGGLEPRWPNLTPLAGVAMGEWIQANKGDIDGAIAKLPIKAGAGATAGAESRAGEEPRAPVPAALNGHATKTQLDQLRTVVADLEKKSPGFRDRVNASLKKSGLSRLEELPSEKADKLLTWCYGESAKIEQARRDTAGAEAGN